MDEKWINCTALKIPNDDYEVIEVIQNSEGTKITLRGLTNEVELGFGFVDSLRVTDEGRRIRTYHEISDIQEYRTNFFGNPLFRIEKSEYIKWIDKESAGFSIGVTHYAVMTRNEIVDIITMEEPMVKYVEI